MSDIVWTERRPGQIASVVSDGHLNMVIIGEAGRGDFLRIPADFPDERYAGQRFQVESVETRSCPVDNHDHGVKMYVMPHDLRAVECPCVGKVFWGFSRHKQGGS